MSEYAIHHLNDADYVRRARPYYEVILGRTAEELGLNSSWKRLSGDSLRNLYDKQEACWDPLRASASLASGVNAREISWGRLLIELPATHANGGTGVPNPAARSAHGGSHRPTTTGFTGIADRIYADFLGKLPPGTTEAAFRNPEFTWFRAGALAQQVLLERLTYEGIDRGRIPMVATDVNLDTDATGTRARRQYVIDRNAAEFNNIAAEVETLRARQVAFFDTAVQERMQDFANRGIAADEFTIRRQVALDLGAQFGEPAGRSGFMRGVGAGAAGLALAALSGTAALAADNADSSADGLVGDRTSEFLAIQTPGLTGWAIEAAAIKWAWGGTFGDWARRAGPIGMVGSMTVEQYSLLADLSGLSGRAAA